MDLLILTVLVVLENVLGTQRHVRTIGKTVRRILEAVRVVATRPAVHVAHVCAQAGFIHHGDILAIRVLLDFPVVGRDVRAVPVAVEQVAV